MTGGLLSANKSPEGKDATASVPADAGSNLTILRVFPSRTIAWRKPPRASLDPSAENDSDKGPANRTSFNSANTEYFETSRSSTRPSVATPRRVPSRVKAMEDVEFDTSVGPLPVSMGLAFRDLTSHR